MGREPLRFAISQSTEWSRGGIQWTGARLHDMGKTAEDVLAMSWDEQVDLIGDYLSEVEGPDRLVGADIYVAIAAPAVLNLPDETIAYREGTKEWTANGAWVPPRGATFSGVDPRLLPPAVPSAVRLAPLDPAEAPPYPPAPLPHTKAKTKAERIPYGADWTRLDRRASPHSVRVFEPSHLTRASEPPGGRSPIARRLEGPSGVREGRTGYGC